MTVQELIDELVAQAAGLGVPASMMLVDNVKSVERTGYGTVWVEGFYEAEFDL